MPHITLHHSANLTPYLDATSFFKQLHTELLLFETISQADLKSCALPYDTFFIGDGSLEQAFVHMDFRLLSGRDVSIRQRLMQACLDFLQQYITQLPIPWLCDVSVEVAEIERSTFGKNLVPHVSG